MDYKEELNLYFIEKLELQTKKIEEIEPLEKHIIINSGSVNKYNGHRREFLSIDGNYNNGFNQLKETTPLEKIKIS